MEKRIEFSKTTCYDCNKSPLEKNTQIYKQTQINTGHWEGDRLFGLAPQGISDVDKQVLISRQHEVDNLSRYTPLAF